MLNRCNLQVEVYDIEANKVEDDRKWQEDRVKAIALEKHVQELAKINQRRSPQPCPADLSRGSSEQARDVYDYRANEVEVERKWQELWATARHLIHRFPIRRADGDRLKACANKVFAEETRWILDWPESTVEVYDVEANKVEDDRRWQEDRVKAIAFEKLAQELARWMHCRLIDQPAVHPPFALSASSGIEPCLVLQ
ncbi:hypothetical protein FIBSPDRAFT_969961 [Athelia psychrophila]|uniref:Uncharacterized protein n=1 Tax=Athelia psychrophila TaxID=1759441 RepID=A0A167T1J4_9AGAM|nr:hypothetical protein FIBSPDRAFT_969961 [Fibularhizoctonia sp. CBS 109695]